MQFAFEELRALLHAESCPCAILDLPTFNANVETMEEIILPLHKYIRLGTKSVRVPALIQSLLARSWVNGVLIFHPNEIAYLQDLCQVKDFLLAYPIIGEKDAQTIAEAAKRDLQAKITIMIDNESHLQILEQAAARLNVKLHVCIDVNMSVTYLGIYAGVRRSPLNQAEEVVKLAQQIDHYPHLHFRGIMGYEAQNAGIGDDTRLYRKMKAKSRQIVNIRRQQIVDALEKAGFHCEIVNGGGSGCMKDTAYETTITEIGAGSALFKSYIFDPIKALEDFSPSLFMALRIVRKPTSEIVTTFSGGFYASAAGKPPKVVLPSGVTPLPMEGFGEVQTPFTFNPKQLALSIGDIILCRFAKAGEPLERFNEVAVVENGKIIDHYPTYRGVGLWCG